MKKVILLGLLFGQISVRAEEPQSKKIPPTETPKPRSTNEFRWPRESGEVLQVALLSELLAGEQSEDDKKDHVRAGAYIGYFSKKACQYGPQLLGWDLKIGNTGQFICALVGATAAGIMKELYDKQNPDTNTAEAEDALATSLGAIVTVPILYIEF